jgi:fructokinase
MEKNSSMATLQRLQPLVVGVGELLWDLLPGGRQLGGAPANFAFHAHNLGARAAVISRVGEDSLGQEILARFNAIGLTTECIQTDREAPTGTVEVSLDGAGTPHFVIRDNAAWDRLAVEQTALAAVRQADAICFGTLAQRTPGARKSIQRIVAAVPADSLRVLDVNLRQQFYSREVLESSLHLANVLKLNDIELPVLAEMFGLANSGPDAIEQLARAFDLRVVALTRGERGSLIYREGQWSEQKPKPVAIADTVGAGDAFSAALVTGLLMSMGLEEVHNFASDVARYVCTQPGAMPSLPSKFRERTSPSNSRTCAT